MKIHYLAFLVLFVIGCAAKEPISVTGIATMNDSGIIQVEDCESEKIYEIGVMATNPYFYVAQKYEELAKNRTVLMSVDGEIKKDENTIEQPTITNIKNGGCFSNGT